LRASRSNSSPSQHMPTERQPGVTDCCSGTP
jgi:hypothetical protein